MTTHSGIAKKLLRLNRTIAEMVVNLVVTLFVLLVLYLSLDLPRLAGELPLLISSITLILFGSVLFKNVGTIREEGVFVDYPEEVRDRRKKLLNTIGWALFLTIVVLLFGIYVGFLLFLPAYTFRKTNLSTLSVGAYSVILWILTMLVFSRLLNRQLYNGIIPIVPDSIVRFIAGF